MRRFLLIAVPICGAMALALGGGIALHTFASGLFKSAEVESGTITSPASVVSDAGASGGQAVHFGATTLCPSSTPNTPDGPDPFGGCFPGPQTTGVPVGTTLSIYSGPCTITADDTLIDSKTINCDLTIAASGVQITRSKINGELWIDDYPSPYSFTISDSEVDAGISTEDYINSKTSIGKSNFVATRVNTHGGIRGVWCEYNCTLRDSWIHGQESGILNCNIPGCATHESGVRMGSGNAQLISHNSLFCEPENVEANDPNAPTDTSGCSADLTGYGDFAPIQNNTIDKNLFVATPGGTCAYGGSSGIGVKDYADDANHVVFTNNIFQRGPAGDHGTHNCGYFFPISDFYSNLAGNVWTNNKWEDGVTLNPDH